MYHSAPGLRVMKEKRRRFGGDRAEWEWGAYVSGDVGNPIMVTLP